MEIWIEKYRPSKLGGMVGQKHIVARLKEFVKKGEMPHCLFAGPAGIGKTTAALCLAKEMFRDSWSQRFMELNASDERGIDTIRTKVKEFARTVSTEGFKIIYLDEADALTRDAQQALRRKMEEYAETCRFILACNYSSRIIEPIQSRCAVFRFARIDEKEVRKYLQKIAESESLTVEPEAIGMIISESEGDLRKAVNILQSSSIGRKSVTEKNIAETIGLIDPEGLDEMMDKVFAGNFKKAREVLVKILYKDGMTGEELVKRMFRKLMSSKIDDKRKVELLSILGDAEFRIVEGSNDEIQLSWFIARACQETGQTS